ncbi:MAG: thiamine pyrophosphate-dependent enzyme, partial [Armatimonadota bacterium]
GTLPPLGALHTCLCMGASIGEAHGINSVCDEQKSVAVIGDSTFLHSGITGLVNIVYNAGNSVVCILDNGTTAMTGGQEHPATGKTLSGKPAGEVSIEDICRGCGVKKITVVDPMDLDATEEAIVEGIEADEPAVVIARRMCVLASRERDLPFVVDAEACVNCGRCLELGCPAIGTEDDHPVIDVTMCTGCTLCAQVCPVDAISQIEE